MSSFATSLALFGFSMVTLTKGFRGAIDFLPMLV